MFLNKEGYNKIKEELKSMSDDEFFNMINIANGIRKEDNMKLRIGIYADTHNKGWNIYDKIEEDVINRYAEGNRSVPILIKSKGVNTIDNIEYRVINPNNLYKLKGFRFDQIITDCILPIEVIETLRESCIPEFYLVQHWGYENKYGDIYDLEK